MKIRITSEHAKKGAVVACGLLAVARLFAPMKRYAFQSRKDDDLPIPTEEVDVPELDEDHTELIWGGSAALLIYQMGIAHAICAQHDRAFLLRRLRVAGLSGGSATAGYMIASLHGIGDMRYWYKQHARKAVMTSAYAGSIRGWSDIIWSLGYEYYRVCHALGLREAHWSTRYRVLTSSLFGKIRVLSRFPNAQSFGDAICSSSIIPFISSPYMGFSSKDVSTDSATTHIDGGFSFSLRRYHPDYKCVHFSLYHNKEHTRTSKSNQPQMHFPITGDRRFLWDNLRCIFSADYADQMFEEGVKWGNENMTDIQRVLGLKSICETIP